MVSYVADAEVNITANMVSYVNSKVPDPVMFQALGTSGTQYVMIGSPVTFGTRDFCTPDVTAYSTTTHLYTVPVSGHYRFHVNIYRLASDVPATFAIALKKNTAYVGNCQMDQGGGSFSRILQCTAGDTIGVFSLLNAAQISSSFNNSFSGELIKISSFGI
jgi:hypothetical protein